VKVSFARSRSAEVGRRCHVALVEVGNSGAGEIQGVVADVAIGRDLQHLFRVHGSRPGEQLRVPSAEGPITSSRVGWVKPDTEAERHGLAQSAHELPRLARDLIATRTGALVTSIHGYLHGPLNGRGWPTPSPPTPIEPKSRPTHCSPTTTTSSDRYPCGVSRPATAAPPSRSANHRTVGLRLV
jgi:hypothetical protein